MPRTHTLLAGTALAVFVLCGVTGCGPNEAALERARAEEIARAERAKAHAQAELDADQAHYKSISTSLADPSAPAAPTVVESPPPAPIPVSAAPTEEPKRPASNPAEVSKLQRSIAALESIEAQGIECATTLRTYAQPDKQQLSQCARFLERATPEARRAILDVEALARDAAFVRDNQGAFLKAQRVSDRLRTSVEFAWERMAAITGRTKP